MAEIDLSGQIDALLTEHVELSVPARLEHLPLLRMLAEAVATKEDFDLDSIADFKIAVDEVASWLVHHADVGSSVSCRYRLSAGELSVSVSAPTADQAVPETDGFGWHVVKTVTDSASYRVTEQGGRVVTIDLVMAARTGRG
ncbi:ATP-binding protein [Amycolatopsis sp. 195334CR]|uniref:ATP-binding protein n=1 Tax=Amycolatopsis sp. 195334CR TaxID=2814588 RepID=UPI001A8ECC6C|nr:ATP-binding protein [Amycolatopsis sp. 195334CR]MBN6041919.1 ATP-binding protein [Amycolatopsis sp. 195334CR]